MDHPSMHHVVCTLPFLSRGFLFVLVTHVPGRDSTAILSAPPAPQQCVGHAITLAMSTLVFAVVMYIESITFGSLHDCQSGYKTCHCGRSEVCSDVLRERTNTTAQHLALAPRIRSMQAYSNQTTGAMPVKFIFMVDSSDRREPCISSLI